SGVPFGDSPRQGDLVLGEPATTAETFEFAVARFDAALAKAGGDTDQEYMARVGKARTLMNLNRYSEAAGLVGSVPTSWRYDIQHSANSGRQENAHYDFGELQGRWSLSDNEGINGLPFRSAMDPRVPWEFGGKGFDEQTDQYLQLVYPNFSAPVTLASGHEARYIEAEAALASGDVTTFLANLNEVRADLAMDDVTDPGTADERLDLLFYERGFTLFGEAQRLADLRRLVRQYNRPQSEVFPYGPFFKGGNYGPDVNWIIPQEEENNPNFAECLDRGA
ncbi:RagB/SusD family nutrient uptake outer membrane protein, partial [Gemmatimonadota bacterium]